MFTVYNPKVLSESSYVKIRNEREGNVDEPKSDWFGQDIMSSLTRKSPNAEESAFLRQVYADSMANAKATFPNADITMTYEEWVRGKGGQHALKVYRKDLKDKAIPDSTGTKFHLGNFFKTPEGKQKMNEIMAVATNAVGGGIPIGNTKEDNSLDYGIPPPKKGFFSNPINWVFIGAGVLVIGGVATIFIVRAHKGK